MDGENEISYRLKVLTDEDMEMPESMRPESIKEILVKKESL